MDTIVCPNCNKKIQIDSAIKHQLEETVLKEEREKQKLELEKAKLLIAEETEKKLKAQAQKELDKSEKEKELLEEKLEKERKERVEFEQKAVEKASKEASDKNRLEKLEYEKRIKDMQKALEDAQRKARQGSQQLQGEVLELDLEEKLKAAFPNDEFLPVPKGVEGGDIWQKVNFKGKTVGTIIWETKRTKAWSNGWITKLKDDAAKVSATEAIIVSQVLPEGIINFDRKDGIWLTGYENAISICRFIRFLITSVSSVKFSSSQSAEEWEEIRNYLLSDTFKHRMQAHFDSIKALKDVLDAEKRSTMLRWKKQESQIEKLDSNTVNFYGELRERVSNLPEIKGLDTPLLGDGDEESQETLI